MVSLKSIQWEYKFALYLGVAALVLSPVAGIISGNPPFTVILRALIFGVVFAGIGFGVVTVIKKFIPELYEAVFVGNSVSDDGVDEDLENGMSQIDDSEMSNSSLTESYDASPDSEGGEVDYSTDNGESVNTGDHLDNPNSSKMGKHILEEKGMEFEPKVMAEAIRTMMSKDDE